jgi:hypothetical protein
MRYRVDLTLVYNGSIVVEAKNENEAFEKAQNALTGETLKRFPDHVEIPNGSFQFGEITADDAYIEENI